MNLKKRRWILIMTFGITCATIWVLLSYTAPLENFEAKSLDWRFRMRGQRKPDSRVVIIALDKESLDEINEPIAFLGKYLAKVIEAVSEGGARVIGLDILQPKNYNNKEYVQSIQALKSSIKKADKTILVYRLFPNIEMPVYARSQREMGVVNLSLDSDSIVRRQKLLFEFPKGMFRRSFALRILERYFDVLYNEGRLGTKEMICSPDGYLLINHCGPRRTFSYISFIDVFNKAIKRDKGFFEKEFTDKVVLIGGTDQATEEFHATPFSPRVPGVEIHANTISTILKGNYIRESSSLAKLCILLFLALGCSILFFNIRPLPGLFYLGIILGLYFFFSVFQFTKFDYALILTPVLLLCPFMYSTIYAYRFVVEDSEKRRLNKLFGRYVSPSVLEKILEDPEGPNLEGEHTNVSILFSDVKDFTKIAERTKPEKLLSLLNEYLGLMTGIVFKNGGALDKFMGDGLMAFFGAPVSQNDHAQRAISTAIEMCSEVDRLKEKWLKETSLEFDIRIGIHSGEIIVGNVGSALRMDYTIMGENVNLAARLEGVNKKFNSRIIISEATYNQIKERIEAKPLGRTRVRGIIKPVNIYQVFGFRTKKAMNV